jgi:hypothetical protein
MKVKMLRSLGTNFADLHPDIKGGVAAAVPGPLAAVLENQVRDFPDEFAIGLIQKGLAEESDEPLTELTKEGKIKAPKPAKLAIGTHVEVTEKTHPDFKSKGVIESAAPVAGTAGESMYTCRRDDGTTFKALDSAVKKV